jgi:hypothetical protein
LDKEKFDAIVGLESGPYKETVQSWIQAAENEFNEARRSVDSKELNRTDKEDFEDYYDDKGGNNNK